MYKGRVLKDRGRIVRALRVPDIAAPGCTTGGYSKVRGRLRQPLKLLKSCEAETMRLTARRD